jgi:lipopolysaccharide export system permease protein
MIKLLDRYILRQFAGTFVFAVFVLSIIAIVIDFTEKVDSFIHGKASGGAIATYYLAFVPYINALLFPLFVFVAVIFFTTRLTARSEIIAMLSSGMSYNRFLRPYLIGGLFFSVLILYCNHTIIPRANRLRLNFENKYINFNSVKSGNDMHFRISPTEFVYLKSYNVLGKNGYTFSYERIAKLQLKEKLWANEIAYDSLKKNWRLTTVKVRSIDSVGESLQQFATLNRSFNFLPKDLVEEHEVKQSMTTTELQAFITRERKKGNPALNAYEVEKYRRTAAPASVFILTVIGAVMSSRKVRGGSGIHLAIGLLIGAAYIVFMQFSVTFSIKGNLHPMVAVWIPNIIFAMLAYIIYRTYSR